MRQQNTRAVEWSAAKEVSQFMREEFGLQPASSWAEWRRDALTVTLTDALTPIGQATQATDSSNQLASAYDTLYHLHQTRLHALISRLAGESVQRSSLDLEAETGSFFLTFYFAAPP